MRRDPPSTVAPHLRRPLGVLMATAALAGAHLWRLRRDLTGPLEELRTTLLRIEAGDVDARVKPRGAGGVREVARALNAMAAEMERLTTEQRDQLGRAQQIAMASRLVRSSLDLTEVLTAAAEAIGLAIEVDRVVVRTLEDGAGPAESGSWSDPFVPPLRTAPPASVLAPPAVQRLVHGDVVEATPEGPVTPEGRAWLDREGGAKVVSVPVFAGGRVVAVAGLHSLDARRTFSATEMRTVETICREVGVAVGHSRLYESQRQLVLELRELDEAKSRFVSTVSHELRTPLTSILGYVEMLQDGEVGEISDEQQDVLAVVGRNTDRLLSLTNDLLTLSRLDSGRFEPSVEPLDITAVVREALSALGPKVEERSQRLVTHVSERLPQVLGDALQIERVVLNLVDNAIKFTPEGGRITVVLRGSEDGDIELVVADTGLGIPEAELERVFTRFFRSSVAEDQAIPGTGLGLVIVKSIIESHGGSVTVTSQVGKGTTFVVRLPAANEDTTPRESEPVASGAGRSGRPTPMEGDHP